MTERPSDIVMVNGKAYHIGLSPEQLADNIFLVGDPARAKKIASRFDAVEHVSTNREFITITGTYKGMPVSVMGTGIGTDNVEIALVEIFILKDFDVEKKVRKAEKANVNLIRVGTSGGVQEELEPGTLAIARYGLGLDSTGLFYDVEPEDANVLAMEKKASEVIRKSILESGGKPRFSHFIHPYASRASSDIVTLLEKHYKQMGAAFEPGITVAAPSFYAASGRYIDGLVNTVPGIKQRLAMLEIDGNRVLNFEMESSLLFLLAGQMGYRAGTICPMIGKASKGSAVIDYAPFIELCISIGLDAMLELWRG